MKDPAKATLLRRFGGWHSPIGSLIGAAREDAILRTVIYDREPLGERWGRGRVTLLGDASHPMTPDPGQGRALAVEDTVTLARCLEEFGATADARRRYERLLSARATMVVRWSRRSGRVGQLDNTLLCWLRDRALAMTPRRRNCGNWRRSWVTNGGEKRLLRCLVSSGARPVQAGTRRQPP